MHLEADGLLPCEEQSYKTRRPHSLLPRPLAHLSSAISVTDHAYCTFFMLIINRKYFTLAQANKIMKAAPPTTWSDGVAPRPLHPHILKGTRVKGKGLIPKSKGKARFTASQMTKFALARFV